MKQLYFLKFLMILCIFVGHQTATAQYSTVHHVAPSPWQYWSNANEIVLSTLSTTPVTVKLYKSDQTLLTTLTVNFNSPVSYRFSGIPTILAHNAINTNYNDRGLVVEATAPVLVNLRNIASDANGLDTTTIKGNASLVSFGNEGMGLEFRLGYYRSNFTGLHLHNPVYSVMAIDDHTTVELNGNLLTVLNAGQSRLFNAPTGSLLVASKPVVANVGSYGDTPQACGGAGEDGTVDQIAPVAALGMQYLVVRGNGARGTGATHPEQSTFIAAQDSTVVTVKNYSPLGVLLNQNNYNLNTAGNFASIHHGDASNMLSSSLITSNKPIIVYSGTAVACETDISTVLPIGGCAGTTNIQTTKFIDYFNNNLPYFGYTIVENATTPVLINGQNLETVTGNTRIPIGNTGFYMLNFTNISLGSPQNIILTSTARMTTCLIQQGDGYSMSGFFSSHGDSPEPPTTIDNQNPCSALLKTTSGLSPYQWYHNGQPIAGANNDSYEALFSGNYTVKGTRDCGETNFSSPLYVEIPPCSDLAITKEIDKIENGVVTFIITAINHSTQHDDTNVIINEFLPSGYTFLNATSTLGTFNPVTSQWNIPLLAKNSTARLTIHASILPEGEYLNVVNITGDNIDPDLDNNTAQIRIALGDLQVTKTAFEHTFIDIGDQIQYEIRIRNKGNGILRNIQILDDNADPGSIVPAVVDVLAPREEVVISAQHTVTFDDYISGQVVNQATVHADTHSGNIVQVSDDPSTAEKDDPTIVKIKRLADLNAEKTNNQIYYTPGTQTEYTIIVINKGPTTALNVKITDPLPREIEVMHWSSDRGHEGTGPVNITLPHLRVSETITIKAKIDIPADRKGNLTNIVHVTSDVHDPNPICLECIDNDMQRIYIPKGISPNGDNVNDFLDLQHFNIAEIKIYNRYGTLVYSKKNYKQEWYGQSNNGTALPSATYFYSLLVDNGDKITGWIYVIR